MFPGTFNVSEEIKSNLSNKIDPIRGIEDHLTHNITEMKEQELSQKLEQLMVEFRAQQTESTAHYRNFQCNMDDSGGAKWSRLYQEDDSSCHSKKSCCDSDKICLLLSVSNCTEPLPARDDVSLEKPDWKDRSFDTTRKYGQI